MKCIECIDFYIEGKFFKKFKISSFKYYTSQTYCCIQVKIIESTYKVPLSKLPCVIKHVCIFILFYIINVGIPFSYINFHAMTITFCLETTQLVIHHTRSDNNILL